MDHMFVRPLVFEMTEHSPVLMSYFTISASLFTPSKNSWAVATPEHVVTHAIAVVHFIWLIMVVSLHIIDIP